VWKKYIVNGRQTRERGDESDGRQPGVLLVNPFRDESETHVAVTSRVARLRFYRVDGIVAMVLVPKDREGGWNCETGRTRSLPQHHASRPLLIFATSVGEITGVRSFMYGIDILVRILGLGPPDVKGLRIQPMSGEWLRQHDAECDKHQTDG
jgi:hypothetical protein